MALSRQDILDEAMAILSGYGLADLSMRRLATALGVRPGALYWHFENKQGLLAALAAQLLGPLAEAPAPPGADIGALVEDWAVRFRRVLLGTRDGAELVSSVLAMRLLTPSPVEELAERLAAAGADPRIAAAVGHFVLGATAEEQGRDQLVALGVTEPSDGDPEESFGFGISLLVQGIRAQ